MRTPAAARFRAARAALNLGQADLAEAAELHFNTVKNLESDGVSSSDTLHGVQVALENLGIEFLEISGRLGIILPADMPEPQAAQVRAARAALLLSRSDLARLSDMGPRTVAKIENADPTVQVGTVKACFDALEALEMQFFEIDGRSVLMLPPYAFLQAFRSIVEPSSDETAQEQT